MLHPASTACASAGSNEKDRARTPGPLRTPCLFDYFNEVLTEVKTELIPVPMPFTAAMIAIAIPAAISPYSMAVAPDSFLKNIESIAFMGFLPRLTSTGTCSVPVRTITAKNLRLFEGEMHKFSGYCEATKPRIRIKSDHCRTQECQGQQLKVEIRRMSPDPA
jgi:hypothetical protein